MVSLYTVSLRTHLVTETMLFPILMFCFIAEGFYSEMLTLLHMRKRSIKTNSVLALAFVLSSLNCCLGETTAFLER